MACAARLGRDGCKDIHKQLVAKGARIRGSLFLVYRLWALAVEKIARESAPGSRIFEIWKQGEIRLASECLFIGVIGLPIFGKEHAARLVLAIDMEFEHIRGLAGIAGLDRIHDR